MSQNITIAKLETLKNMTQEKSIAELAGIMIDYVKNIEKIK